MKIIIPFLLLIVFISCTKQHVVVPKTADQSLAANIAVAYKDNNISIVNFKAQQSADNGIKITFTTLYEKNIVRLEILRGLTANNLCSIYKQRVNADSYSAIEYSTGDAYESKALAIYYMVKYTLANGDWGYTPVFKLSL